MKKSYHLVLLMISGAWFLTSCATYHNLNSPVLTTPIRDATMSEVASVKISERRRTSEKLIVTMFDGEKIADYKVASGIYQVPPGIRRIKVEYSEISRGGSNRFAGGELEVDLRPGRRYIPNAKRTGDTVKIWFVDVMSREMASDFFFEDIYLVDRRDGTSPE